MAAFIICVRIHDIVGNHQGILRETGYTDVREYRYYKKETRGLDYEGMLEDIKVS